MRAFDGPAQAACAFAGGRAPLFKKRNNTAERRMKTAAPQPFNRAGATFPPSFAKENRIMIRIVSLAVGVFFFLAAGSLAATAGNGALIAYQLRQDFAARAAQAGAPNQVVVDQDGSGHYTVARQRGGRNVVRMMQRGLANGALSDQSGDANFAAIHQRGRGLNATVTQDGSGNVAIVRQFGRGHAATVTQTGSNNVARVIQIGRGQEANVVQTGNDGVMVVVQGGFGGRRRGGD